MSITHLHGTTPPQNDYEPRTEPILSTALATGQHRPERVTDQRERLGGALEEIRAMGDKLDQLRELAADRASTIRELNAHVDYLEGRIVRLEDEVSLYMRKSVSLAQQMRSIAALCEDGRRLAEAAEHEGLVHEESDGGEGPGAA